MAEEEGEVQGGVNTEKGERGVSLYLLAVVSSGQKDRRQYSKTRGFLQCMLSSKKK